MLQAVLEGIATFGPMVLLMLTPILIPLLTGTIGAIADRRKASSPARDAEVVAFPTRLTDAA